MGEVSEEENTDDATARVVSGNGTFAPRQDRDTVGSECRIGCISDCRSKVSHAIMAVIP